MDMGSLVLVPIFSVTVPFLALFGILYVYYQTRNRERLALLEKGFDPKSFENPKKDRFNVLKWGLILAGVAIGLIFGNIFDNIGLNEEVSYFSMIFLFAGAALLLAFHIQRKYNLEKK